MGYSFQRYENYKKVDDLAFDELPVEWTLKKVKYLFTIGRGRVISQEELDDNGVFPVYSSQTQNNGCLGFIHTYDFDCKQITWTTDGANAGTVFLREGKHNCTNVCGTLQPISKNLNFSFYLYSLQYVTQFYKRPDTNGAKIMNGEMAAISLCIPSDYEQQKIANFLDHETAKIDTLIAKQEKLIELLKEKRQAVISHAVTKGLNPQAPMKDSGVEWLGEVPEHWEVTKLKWKTSTTSGGTPTTSKYEMYYKDGYIPWIRTTDLNNGKLLETPVNITSKALADTACSILPKNSILLAMYGGAGSIGKHSLLMFEATINQAVCGIYPSSAFESEFLHYFYEFYRPFWMINAAGTRKDPNIGQDHIKEGKVVLPPVAEQRTIVAHINKTLALLDRLNVKATDAIELAKERKTALISAAVTGKIDVRHFVAEQGQPQGVQG
ncbi:restriction endonuclease subunit S [Vibrio parahaemolyticus]|uniref:restriction endonuclease subunit S n=1 Tax=Vibrio parahaemolyticus TaxID=670 RepID=UPI001B830308|nr:restriction endonuclease subunit S [Vibrio parahaemolyticus]MCS0050708.1 restriction endonuclease subunit S [Vibrio parahaemolyticus]MDF4951606.1 restriction endonuclease subunit S [Vibrio parahaemolyticus]MDG2837611.1 restriction endonuclease subunit S [Vibrio parahaemolyticus]HBC3540211.1 restriction endonuclease subunit S [Vibrio parahaemolyticus]HBC3816552.1 restriction endonuclease subunit S [Vibrio parahaemolyticus]